MRPFFAFLALFSTVFPLFSAWGQAFSVPRVTVRPLISILYPESYESVLGAALFDYAQVASARMNAKVLLTSVPLGTNAGQIQKGLEKLYKEGQKTPENTNKTSQLVGIVLLSELLLPEIEKEEVKAKTPFPYVDFVDKNYEYDDENNVFLPQKGDQKPEIWHGLVPGTAEEVKILLEKFVSAENAVAQGEDPHIFVADFATQSEKRPAISQSMYKNYTTYGRLALRGAISAKLFGDLQAELTPDFTPPSESEVTVDVSAQNMPDTAAASMFRSVLKPYSEIWDSFLTLLYEKTEKTGRYTAQNTDTTISFITQRDAYELQTQEKLGKALGSALENWLLEQNIVRHFDIKEDLLFQCGKDRFWFGIPRKDITKAEECTILRGTPFTDEAPFAQMVQQNVLFNNKTVNECFGMELSKKENKNNGFKKIESDSLGGCCATNLEYDKNGMVTALPVPCALEGESSLVSPSTWNCGLIGGDDHLGARVPLLDAEGGHLAPTNTENKQYWTYGADGCEPIRNILPLDPLVGNVTSFMRHNEPTKETLNVAAKARGGTMLPIDEPRGVSFYDHSIDATFQRIFFYDPAEFATFSAFLAQINAEITRINGFITLANENNPAFAQPLLTFVETEAFGEIPEIYLPIFNEFIDDLPDFLTLHGKNWLYLPEEQKNLQAFWAVFNPQEAHLAFDVPASGYESFYFLQEAQQGFVGGSLASVLAEKEDSVLHPSFLVHAGTPDLPLATQFLTEIGTMAVATQMPKAKTVLQSQNQSIEDVNQNANMPFFGNWNPMGLYSAGNSTGVAGFVGSSEAFVLLGDPTYAISGKNSENNQGITPDVGAFALQSHDGRIAQVFSADVNADSFPDVLYRAGDSVFLGHHAENKPYSFHNSGKLFDLWGGVAGDVIKYDNNADNFWDFAHVSPYGDLYMHKNENGAFKTEVIEQFYPPETQKLYLQKEYIVSTLYGKFNNDEYSDILLVNNENALFVALGRANGFAPPTFLAHYAQVAPNINEFYEKNTEIDSFLKAYSLPHLSGVEVWFDGLEIDENPLAKGTALLHPETNISRIFTPLPQQEHINASFSLVNDTVTLRLRSDVDIPQIELLLPAFGDVLPDSGSIAVENVLGEPIFADILGGSGVYAYNFSLLGGSTAEFVWNGKRFSENDEDSTENDPLLVFTQQNVNGGDDILVPWQENDARVLHIYENLQRRVENVDPPQIPAPDGFENPGDLTAEDAEALNNYINALDEDEDGIPDLIDVFSGADLDSDNGFADVLGFLTGQKAKGACGNGACGMKLNLPSQAFLAPGNIFAYIPPFSVPGPPTPGLPVVWLPPIPFAPTHLASVFRFYVMPTTSLRVGLAGCFGNFNGFSTGAPLFTCLATATPQISLPRACPAPPLGFSGDTDFISVPTQNCSVGKVASSLLDEESWNQTQKNTAPLAVNRPQSTIKPNIQGGGADFITNWVADSTRSLGNFTVPQVKVTLPALPKDEDGFVVFKRRPIEVFIPEFSQNDAVNAEKSASDFEKKANLWEGELESQLAQIVPRLEAYYKSIDAQNARSLQGNVLLAQNNTDVSALKAETLKDIEDLQTMLQNLQELKQNVKDNAARIAQIQKNAKSLKAFPEKLEAWKQEIKTVDDLLKNRISGWQNDIQARISAWLALKTDIEGILETFEDLPAVFSAFEGKCPVCPVQRGKGPDFLINVLLSFLNLPVLSLPNLTDVELDLTDILFGFEVLWPEITFQTVKVNPMAIPVLPAVPKLNMPSSQRASGLQTSVFYAQNGNNARDMKGLTDDVPKIPKVRQIPDVPTFEPELPTPELPEMELPLPPEPPKSPVPDVLSNIKPLLNAMEKFMPFLCLLNQGIAPVAEWDLKAGIERLTNRTKFTKFDFILPSLSPPHGKTLQIPQKIKPKMDFVQEFPQAVEQIHTYLDEWNCSIGVLNGETDACEPKITALTVVEEYAHVIEEIMPDKSVKPNMLALEQAFSEIKVLAGQDELHNDDFGRYLVFEEDIQPQKHVMLAQSEPPFALPDDFEPAIPKLPLQSPGTHICNAESGMAEPMFADTTKNVLWDYLKPDFHVSEQTHTAYASTNACENNGVDIVYAQNDAVFIKSCAAQHPNEANGEVEVLNFTFFEESFAPAKTYMFDSGVLEQKSFIEKKEQHDNYYEMRFSDRVDAVWDETIPHVSERWDRMAFLHRDEPKKYEVRLMTTRLLALQGNPTVFAPVADVLTPFAIESCADDAIIKPFYAQKVTILGKEEKNRFEIQVPPRPNQPEERIELTLRENEETHVENAFICLTEGELEVVLSENFSEIEPRENLYLPNGTKLTLETGDYVALELFDGTKVEIFEGETYEVRIMTEKEAFLRHVQAGFEGHGYAVVTSATEDAYSWQESSFYEAISDYVDDVPPEIVVLGGKNQKRYVGQAFLFDLTSSFDNAGIQKMWIDADLALDADNDGILDNDEDILVDLDRLLVDLAPVWETDDLFFMVWAEDNRKNTTKTKVTLQTLIPTPVLWESTPERRNIRGEIAEQVENVPVRLQKWENDAWVLLDGEVLSEKGGEFLFFWE